MNKRTILLLVPLVLALALLGAYALTPKESAPTPSSEEASGTTTPVTETRDEERPPLEPDPIFATRPVEVATTLKVAEAPQVATLIVEGASLPIRVAEGSTVEEAMIALESEGTFAFSARTYSGLGSFVEEIQGKRNTSEYYWILHVNGKKSATGISQTRISSGDIIEWKYEKKY